MTPKTLDRRGFLKLGAAGAMAALGMQVAQAAWPAKTEAEGSSDHRWAMVIDQAKCVGCGRCTLACRATNDVNPKISWNVVLELEPVGDRQVFLLSAKPNHGVEQAFFQRQPADLFRQRRFADTADAVDLDNWDATPPQLDQQALDFGTRQPVDLHPRELAKLPHGADQRNDWTGQQRLQPAVGVLVPCQPV